MKRAFRGVALAVQRSLNRFDPLRHRFDPAVVDGPDAPVLIISPPRTGSTFVYQVLVDVGKVAYISNLMAVAPQMMLALQWASTRIAPGYRVPYSRGDWGFVPGILAPSEAGKVMDRWFDPGRADRHRVPVRQTLAGMTRIGRGPVVIKSLSLAFKLDAVLEILPKARFLVLTRSPLAVAQSLLIGRRRRDLHPAQIEALLPPGIAAHSARGLPFQVAWQVVELNRLIDSGLHSVGPDRIHRISFERFFSSPEASTAEILRSMRIARRPGREIPLAPADVGAERRVDMSTWCALEDAFRELGVAPDPL